MKLQLHSNPDALCLVRATLERATELLHFSAADSRSIVRSVDEALANVIRHASGGKPGLPIDITFSRVSAGENSGARIGVEVLMEDAGVSPDISKIESRSLEEVRPGGLGLHFIRQSMDVMEFSHKEGRNRLRLVKYLVPATSLAKPAGE